MPPLPTDPSVSAEAAPAPAAQLMDKAFSDRVRRFLESDKVPSAEKDRLLQTLTAQTEPAPTETTTLDEADAIQRQADLDAVPSALQPLAAIGQAGIDRVGMPALRLGADALGMDTGGAQPRGWMDTAADAASIGGAAAAPGLTALGAATQGGAEAAGASPEWASILGSGAEMGAGIGGVYRAGKALATRGARLVSGERAAAGIAKGASEFLPHEQVGQQVVAATSKALGARRKVLGAAIAAAEDEAAKRVPQILSGSVGAQQLQGVFAHLDDTGAELTGRARFLSQKIQKALRTGQPVETKDVLQLNRSMREIAGGAKSIDTSTAVNARKVGVARGKLNDAVAATLPDDVGEAWLSARTAYANEIVEPKRALRNVLNRNTTPAQAFQRAFSSTDPNVFRTLLSVAEKSPALKMKLRLGVLDTLDAASGGFKDSKVALEKLDTIRPMLEANKLFTTSELTSLDMMLSRGTVRGVASRLASTLGSVQGASRAGAAGGLGYLFASGGPLVGLKALFAYDVAAPFVQRLRMTPIDDPSWKALGAMAAKHLTRGLATLTSEHTEEADAASELDALSEP